MIYKTLREVEDRMIELERAGQQRSDEMADLRDLRSRFIYGPARGSDALTQNLDHAVDSNDTEES